MISAEPILYFGYGAMASAELMQALLGKVPRGTPASVKHHKLCIQEWSEIPLLTRAHLLDSWTPGDFQAYAIRGKRGVSVSGIIWELEQKDMDAVAAWNFHSHWYEPYQVFADVTGCQVLAYTDAVSNPNPERTANGLFYDPFLNAKPKMLRVARLVHSMLSTEGN